MLDTVKAYWLPRRSVYFEMLAILSINPKDNNAVSKKNQKPSLEDSGSYPWTTCSVHMGVLKQWQASPPWPHGASVSFPKSVRTICISPDILLWEFSNAKQSWKSFTGNTCITCHLDSTINSFLYLLYLKSVHLSTCQLFFCCISEWIANITSLPQ